MIFFLDKIKGGNFAKLPDFTVDAGVDLTFANSEFYYLNDEEANAIKQSYKITD